MNYKYIAEELLLQPRTFEIMSKELGDDLLHLQEWSRDLHAKTENYKENTYYHVISYDSEDDMMSGVGQGLYLGKDKEVLIKFYGLDYIDNDEKVPLQTFYGNPNFLDLTDYDNFDIFKEHSKKEFPNEEYNNELKRMTLKLGYDGIRYYDPIATGEEFVLYNTNEVKLIETELI